MKRNLTELQIFMIKNHTKVVDMYAKGGGVDSMIFCQPHDAWKIEEDEDAIYGDTSMDNFDMRWFLEMIGVKEEDLKYKDGY
jgi:hypothetical protein